MTTEKMHQTVIVRASEMLKDKKINSIYQSFKTESEAKTWILTQALITLLYSHEERLEMIKPNFLSSLSFFLEKSNNAVNSSSERLDSSSSKFFQ